MNIKPSTNKRPKLTQRISLAIRFAKMKENRKKSSLWIRFLIMCVSAIPDFWASFASIVLRSLTSTKHD